MLQEVRGSVGLVSLCPATGIDPHADSRGLSPWRVFRSDLNPVSHDPTRLQTPMQSIRTVKPLERVVDWVVDGRATGEAKPRLTGWMDFRAARLRRAWLRLKAKRREAIVTGWKVGVEREGGRMEDDEAGRPWSCEVEVRESSNCSPARSANHMTRFSNDRFGSRHFPTPTTYIIQSGQSASSLQLSFHPCVH